jgi:hypothetical protein
MIAIPPLNEEFPILPIPPSLIEAPFISLLERVSYPQLHKPPLLDGT